MVTTRQALHSSKSVEWYTPQVFTDAAKEVMGSIDLDPASCAKANKHIKASKIFTKSDDGLSKKWHGNVFLNPPYGRGGQATWTKKLIEEWKAQNTDQAILLCNAATDTLWFQPLWDFMICFAKRRVKFVAEDGITKHSPTHANVFVYFGHPGVSNGDKFKDIFGKFGHIVY